MGLVVGIFVVWPLSILISWAAVLDYNAKVKAKGQLLAQDGSNTP